MRESTADGTLLENGLRFSIELGEASVDAFFDLTTLSVVGTPQLTGSTPSARPSARLQRAGLEQFAWEGRTRLNGTAKLNWSVFPAEIDGLPDSAVRGPMDPSPFEAVDLALIEGPGVAARPSSRLQALTFWWVQDAKVQAPDLVVSAGGQERVLAINKMQGYVSSTSMQVSGTTLGFAAITYSDLEQLADKDGTVRVALASGQRIAGEVVFDVTDRQVARSSLRLAHAQDLLLRSAISEIAWESRVDAYLFPTACVNNHPIKMPHETTPINGVVRFGDVKRDLFYGDGVAFAVSPTIASACLWMLVPTDMLPESAVFRAAGRATKLEVAVQDSYLSFTSEARGPLSLACAMVPISQIDDAALHVAGPEVAEAVG